MNKKLLISLSTVAAVVLGGVTTRQVIGNGISRECGKAVDTYTTVAKLQLNDMKTADQYLDMIAENPFSALMVGGDVAKLGIAVSNRWDEYNSALDSKDEVCYPEGSVNEFMLMHRFVLDQQIEALDIQGDVNELSDSIQDKASQF